VVAQAARRRADMRAVIARIVAKLSSTSRGSGASSSRRCCIFEARDVRPMPDALAAKKITKKG